MSADEEDSSKNGPPLAKTPVSLLQELYVKRGMTPNYDLVQIEGAVHEPTFKYRVSVGEFVATGIGQSKKKAKHAAAKAVLEKIKAVQVKVNNQLCQVIADETGRALAGDEVTSDMAKALLPASSAGSAAIAAQLPDLTSDVLLSPYEDGIAGNPVGELQEMCMNRRMQPPAYDVSSEEGQPHERNFVIVCSVGKHRESGEGKSKKIAKRSAAHKMLKRLKIHPVENDDQFVLVDEDDLASSIAQKMKAMKLKDARAATRPQEGSSMAKALQMSRENLGKEPLGLLKAICDEEHYSVTFVDIEEWSTRGQCQCLVQISTSPVAVCYGVGASEKEARNACAINALDYFRDMLA